MNQDVREIADAADRSDRGALAARYRAVRRASLTLAAPLSAEDQQVQSMPDVSPTKWHLAHVTWFFETFLLAPAGRPVFDPAFAYLFNSYYETVGARHPRPERGLITRPGLDEVHAYRAFVDAGMEALIAAASEAQWAAMAPLVELGLNHEEQHQELLLMDIKHVLSLNPLQPAYAPAPSPARAGREAEWIDFDGGLVEIGARGGAFAFDNETPRHKAWLEPYRLKDRLVTAGEWLAFVEDGGYRRPELWLSDGWAAVNRECWEAPLYWRRDADGWSIFTLHGRGPLDPHAPVCHVSFYEADAYARWAGARLPTEAEWEAAAVAAPWTAPFALHPTGADDAPGLRQLAGSVWQWTASAYLAYPRFKPLAGAVGEYNGKFMSGQMVLRGGACVTPPGHARPTYRNFFPPAARWPFTGVRLADDA
jgi:ergothioneine biosynthesis protein EgtB